MFPFSLSVKILLQSWSPSRSTEGSYTYRPQSGWFRFSSWVSLILSPFKKATKPFKRKKQVKWWSGAKFLSIFAQQINAWQNVARYLLLFFLFFQTESNFSCGCSHLHGISSVRWEKIAERYIIYHNLFLFTSPCHEYVHTISLDSFLCWYSMNTYTISCDSLQKRSALRRSPLLCVNESLIGQGFRAGAKAILDFQKSPLSDFIWRRGPINARAARQEVDL